MRDHTSGERITVNKTGRELLGKMIFHIPDKNFRMVRYYGFYSNKEKDLLYKIHSQFGNIIKASLIKQEKRKNLKENSISSSSVAFVPIPSTEIY